MKKHLNKILIFVINVLLTVVGVLLIKDYNNSRVDSASSINLSLEPLSSDNSDSQILDEAVDSPIESVNPANSSQSIEPGAAGQTAASPLENVQSNSSSTASSSKSNKSSSSTSTKKSSTPKTKTS